MTTFGGRPSSNVAANRYREHVLDEAPVGLGVPLVRSLDYAPVGLGSARRRSSYA